MVNPTPLANQNAATSRSTPMPADAAGSRHFARFYVNDETLVESVAEYVIRGIRDGAAAIVIATERPLASLDERWGREPPV
jgi:hypothetical protein